MGRCLIDVRLSTTGNVYGNLFAASLLQFGANIPQLKVLPLDLAIPPWPVGIMTLRIVR